MAQPSNPGEEMSQLMKHAQRELALIDDGSPEQSMINAHMMRMVEEFSRFGHSGGSASYTIRLLAKLLRYEPLTPLTGDESEWVQVDENLYQNRRCGRIFSHTGTPDGPAFDVEGKVFVYPDGSCITNANSRVPVTFPYVLGSPLIVEVVELTHEAVANDD